MDEYDAKAGAASETVSRGALTRGIVIEELRIVYVPVSKAACTSLRWLLADLLGLARGSFEDPETFRATQGQTIQNVNKWPPEYIVQRAAPSWLQEVAEDESWFRFSVVRDPARRLWSAWQSKLLLRQPGFVERFGGEPWFPEVPSSPEDVIEGYERFVGALEAEEDRRPSDPHWRLQAELLGDAPPVLNHIGKVEELGDTLELLGEHVARFGRDLPPMRRENATPLPYPDGLLSEDAVRVVREHYAADYRAFGYAVPEAGPASEDRTREWKERTRALLPSVQTMISHNERLTTLDRSLQEARRQAAQELKRGERLRREVAKRDGEIFRLRGRMKELKSQAATLHEIEQSTIWRYSAPLRRLVSTAKGARGRLRGNGGPG